MEQTEKTEYLIKRYLLGEISPVEMAALEDEYFLNRARYDLLCRTEDELIDRYVRGALSPLDLKGFERCYLGNPCRWRHVKFARALAQAIDEEPAAGSAVEETKERPWIARPEAGLSWWSHLVGSLQNRRLAPGLAFVTAALLIGFGWMWFAIETSRLAVAQRESETRRQHVQAQARQIAALEAEARQLAEQRNRLQTQLQETKEIGSPSPRIAPATVYFPLSISVFRSFDQDPQTLIIPRGAEEVRLLLSLLDHDFKAYQVTLLTADGEKVLSRTDLKPRVTRSGAFVVAGLPARKLTSGDMVLDIGGIGPTGEVERLGKTIIKVSR